MLGAAQLWPRACYGAGAAAAAVTERRGTTAAHARTSTEWHARRGATVDLQQRYVPESGQRSTYRLTVPTDYVKTRSWPLVVGFHGWMKKEQGGKRCEYWMLLEYCPNGSLIDVLYRKGRGGEFRSGMTDQRAKAMGRDIKNLFKGGL